MIQRPPLGPELWADTMLTLPKEETGRCYHDLFTGARLTVTKTAAGAALPVGDMLSDFPVALLHTA